MTQRSYMILVLAPGLFLSGCAAGDLHGPRTAARQEVRDLVRSAEQAGRYAPVHPTGHSRRHRALEAARLPHEGRPTRLATWGGADPRSTGTPKDASRPRRRRRPLPDFWDTVRRDVKDLPAVFWDDTKKVYTNKTNLLILGLTYGGSLTLSGTGPDKTVRDSFRGGGKIKNDFRDAGGLIGNPGLHFGLAGLWYLAGQQSQDQQTYEVGTKLFRALTLTGATTLLGQLATADDAPNGQYGTFPSAHAASSFAFASVLDHEYGPWVGIPLYLASGFVGWTRLEDREHELSDVVMGSVLGLVIGHTIAGDGEPLKLLGGRVMPFVDPSTGSNGIAWVKPLTFPD